MVFKVGKLLRKANAARLATYLIALWKLVKHPETPRAVRIVALVLLAYVVSPIDLIPDFIPVLGQLDELIIVPLGIALVTRLVPKPVWEARLLEAEASREKLPRWWWGALIVGAVWLVLLALFAWWVVTLVRGA